MAEIKLSHKISNDEYTEYIYNTFDIQDRETTSVTIPMNVGDLSKFDWNIGVIYGSSGSGKSSILNKLGGTRVIEFDENKSLISNFHWLTPEEAGRVLTSIGLSSIPTWLRPYRLLSNGEKYRAELAYVVSSAKEGDTILIDEYTSVVDRDVAKAMSFALQKYIRRENKQLILASCHYDIMEWLLPDWTVSPEKDGGTLVRGEWLRQSRPDIHLHISRVEAKTWDFFKKHHYLSEEANTAFIFLLYEWNNKPVAIGVVGRQVGKGHTSAFRGSRTVVLPDYQGLGIGSHISNLQGGIAKNLGAKYFTKTVNPALGEYRNNRSTIWEPTAHHLKQRNDVHDEKIVFKSRKQRPSYCHRYIGPAVEGYDDLFNPIADVRMMSRVDLDLVRNFWDVD
tara:strand:- start:6447 stop:7628 length:1182 start_codon:yes stop_codon:yes gene_type:complete